MFSRNVERNVTLITYVHYSEPDN